MPQKPLTSKQQYWLRHVTAADASDSSMAQYAQSKQLSVRKLYHWKSQLMKLDLYPESSDVAPASFVKLDPVHSMEQRPSSCSVTLANGTRIEFTGPLDLHAIQSIMTSAGALQ